MSATCSLGPIACREKHPQCSCAAVVLVLGDLQGDPLTGKFSQRFQSGADASFKVAAR